MNRERTARTRRVIFEQLERRVLLSADPVLDAFQDRTVDTVAADSSNAAIIGPAATGISNTVAEDRAVELGDTNRTTEVYFIDSRVPDALTLIEDLQDRGQKGLEIVLVDARSSGIDQVSEALANFHNLDAVHIISHGTQGAVQIGNTALDLIALEDNSDAIQAWGKSFAENGDLLFYGCDLAASAQGEALVRGIASLTGADVAASEDLTGSADLGGDWELEYTTGDIDAPIRASAVAEESWSGVLATFVVDSTADTVDANLGDGIAQDASGNTTLRAAVMQANTLAGVDTISLSGVTYTLAIAGQGENAAASGDLDVSEDLTITGVDASTTVIDGGALDRVFHIQGGSTVVISDVTIQNGDSSGSGNGGGMWIDDPADIVTLNRVIINGNTADTGGGIYNQDATLNFTDGEISGNFAVGGGQSGGGLDNEGVAVLERVTVSGNTAGTGGGIVNNAAGSNLTLTNVTISGNAATNGGGLFTTKNSTLTNVTIADNSATNSTGGSGIHRGAGSGSIQLTNTIVAGNTGTPDMLGNNFTSLGNNLIGDIGGASGFTDGVNGDQVGTTVSPIDPLLGPLADNGGFAQTHALQVGSTAIDAGTSTGAPTTDQRGIARNDGFIDIGAYEIAGGNVAPTITSNGGGATANINVAENVLPVTTVIATDADGDTPTYGISGGADAMLFNIDTNSGALSFIGSPNFEFPQDADRDNAYQVDVTADDGFSGTDVQAITVTVTDVAEPPGTLWLSSDADLGSPGADGQPNGWSESDILEFGGPDLAFGATTVGDLSRIVDLDQFMADSADLGALHYVSRDITVGSGADTFDLLAGDLLLSFHQDETIMAPYSATGSNMLVHDQDVVVFRPTAPGDYTDGTFHMLLDDVVPVDLRAISLVERNTTVGDVRLNAGDFIIAQETAPSEDIYVFSPTGVGAGAKTDGTITTLIDGSDINIDASVVRGLELIESTTWAGGQLLQAGSILVSLRDDEGTVGDNNLPTQREDVFVLEVGSAGANATAATASMFLNGSDVGLDGNPGSENPYAIALVGAPEFVVDTTSDTSDGDTTSVSNLLLDKGADGRISLREAIEAANNTANGGSPDEIHFDIPLNDLNHFYYQDDGVGGQITLTNIAATTLPDGSIVDIDPDFAKSWFSIQVGGGLPSITEALVIDGTTQTGFVDTPIIELDGNATAAGINGLTITAGSSTIRGLVINQFGGDGIHITTGNGNLIEGNYIGTDVSGTLDLGNAVAGIFITGGASSNTIGGLTAAHRNVISGNNDDGLKIEATAGSGNTVIGNYIGLDVSGTSVLGNAGSGIDVQADGNTIGGSAAETRNISSGNTFNGVVVSGSGNTVQGNYFGTDVNGNAVFGNGKNGVWINGGSNNLIGGTAAGAGNLVAGNTWDGIRISGGAATGNAILGNVIHSNTGLAIDLGADGVTPNISGDSDVGANNLQNFPEITTAELSGTDLTLSGSLDTDGLNKQYRIEFYGNTAGTQDASNGEGRFYLGATTVTTNGGGDATFSSVTLPGITLGAGDYVTATATFIDDPAQVGIDDSLAYTSTSEFAANVAIVAVNEVPTTTGLAPVTAGEDATNSVVDLFAAFADTEDSDANLTYTITTNTNPVLFSATPIDAVAGALTLDYAPNAHGTADITVRATDTGGLWVESTFTVTVNPVNDAPTVSGTATNPTFAQGGAPADLFNAVSIGTVESGQSIDQIVLTVANVTDGNDEIINIDGTAVALTNANSGTTATNSYGYTVALTGNTATVVLTTTGATPSAAQTVIDALSYKNNAAPPTEASRVVTLVSVKDSGGTANGGNDTNFAGIASTVVVTVREQALWLSADEDSPSGADGLPGGWTQGEVLEFGGPDLALGASTDGDFASVIDFDTFAVGTVDVGALHYVGRNITVGAGQNSVDLRIGDVLVSFNQDEDILAAFYETGLQTTVHINDLLVFRPDSLGDYASGTFYMLLNGVPDPLGTPINSLHAISLVEQNTIVGGTLLEAGTFLFSEQSGVAPNTPNHIYHFAPTAAGKTAASGTSRILIDGDDINIENGKNIRGLELVEKATSVGGMNFDAGDILVTLSVDDSVVGDAPTLATSTSDIFVLKVTQAEPEPGNATAATANMILDGSDVNFSGSERAYALTLYPGNVGPQAQDDRVGLSFDGVDDYVQIANDPTLVMNNTFTMEAWVNLSTSATGGSQLILNKEGEYELGVTADTGELKWAIAEGGAWAWRDTGAFVEKGEWTHVAVTYNAGVVLTYINGALVHTFNQTGPVGDAYPGFNELRIGGRENTTTQRFEGEIDEVRLWNVTRTEGEIKLAKDGLLTGAESGLVGYWRFDEGTGSQVFDISPSNNDGTLGGADAPAAEPSWAGYVTDEDTVLTVPTGSGVLSNDIDADGDGLTVTNLNDTGMLGVLVLNADGSFTYDPRGAFDVLAPGEHATETFTYTASDGNGDSNMATVTLTVTGVNDAPATTPVTLAPITEDGGIRVITQAQLLANASDVEGDSLTPTGLAISAGSGTLVDNFDGTWNYTPALNDDSAVSFSYTITDSTDTVAGSATLDITPVNDAPTTSPVTLTAIAEDSGARTITQGELLANAADTEGDSLTATGLSINSGSGTLVDNLDGTWSYTPALNDDTTVSFSYSITDGVDTVAGSTTLDITPVNDPPTTTPVTLAPIAEDSGGRLIIQAQLLANATDTEGDSLTATGLAISAGSGTLVDNLDGTWNYSPALNDDTTVSFSYSITDDTDTVAGSATLDITPVNDAPTTSPVTLTAVAEDSGVRLITQAELLANASDVEGDSLAATGLSVSGGAGTLVDNFDGTWNYTPALNDDSAVSFSYSITDSTDTVAGSATLDITPVNDAPTTSAVILTAIAEDSGARLITQAQLLSNASDIEGDTLTATGLTINSGSGTLVDNLDGTWNYSPALNDDTAVSFSYSITDGSDTVAGSANLDITSVNDPPTTSPVALTAVAEDSGVRLITQAELLVNASDIEGDSLTATGLAISAGSGTLVDNLDGTWNYSPALNDDTAVSFSYSITDGTDAVTGSATLDITPVNDAPTTTPVTLAPIAEDSGGRLITQAQLLANASDIEGDSLTATGLAISAGSGTLVDNLDGTWNYSPALNDDTTVSFSYSITDDTDTVAGSATLDITPVNDAPTTSPVTLTAVAEDSGGRLITQAQLLVNASDIEGDSLTATGLAISAGSGTLVDNLDGTWNYSPALNDDTTVSFSYSITDGTDTVAGSATLDITPVNDAPTTSPVTLTAVAEDSGVRLITQAELLVNASDIEGDSLTATGLAISAGSGTLVDNLDGTWNYSPALNDDTAVSFSYSITDGSDTVAGSATLDITPVNDPPTTSPVTLTAVAEDSGGRLITQAQLLVNASDIEGDSLTATGLAISAGSGALVDNLDGTWNYSPALNDDTVVSFSYTITDSTDTVAGSATLDITPVNDAPTTSPVTLTAIAEDSGARTITQGELLANAADTEGDSLTATGLSINSGSGTLVDNLDGTWNYTPALNDDTTVSFSYSITDGSDTVAGSANLNITSVNDPPTTSPVALTAVAEDSGVRLITQAELLANASDVEGDSLAATGLSINSGSGTLIDNLDGTWNYTPALNDDTAVSFSYSITDGTDTVAGSATLDITPVNDAPTTSPVTLTAVAEDSGVRLITQAELLANASDVEGDSLAATGLSVSGGAGTLVDNLDGTWNYTPALNDDTAVSFSYSITDGTDTVAGSATLDITAVNDAPTTTPVTLAPIAEDSGGRLITQAQLLANASDIEGNSLTATGLAISAGSGTLVDNFDGTWNYTPALNDDTTASFSYSITDGTDTIAGSATLDITPVNDPPTTSPVALTAVAEDSGVRLITQAELLANASDVEGDSLAATGLSVSGGAGTLVDNFDGTWNYTPALNDDTAVSFGYSITDGTDTVAASATLDITPVNDAPTTSAVILTAIAEDSGARLITQAQLLSNASDIEGDTLTATGLTINSGSGTLVDNLDGTWNYSPALNDGTAVSFSYSITDGSDTVAGSANLDITSVNDPPTTSPVALTAVAEDSGVRLITQAELLANASDVEGDSLAATGLSVSGGAGTLVDNFDGTWNYTPALNDDSAVSFSYSITDSTDTVAGSATLDITPVNDAPTTSAVILTAIAEDSGARLITQAQLLSNASDIEGDTLTATGLTINSGSGTLVDNLDGTWNYSPALNDDTAVSFSYSITDGSDTVAGSANLDITSVNDPPTTSPVALTAVAEDSGVRLITQAELLANASDVEGDSLAATGLSVSGGAGTLVDNFDGTWNYTLALNDDSAVSFSYTITDSTDTVAGSATLDITPVNDAPTTTPVTLTAIAEDSGVRLITQAELLANATDTESDSLTATGLAISAGSGTLVDNFDGTWNYTPALNDDSAVSFSYTITDSTDTVAGSATLDITPVNDAPTTSPVTLTAIAEDSSARTITQGELLANAADTEGNSLTATGLSINSGSGTLVDNLDGTWSYTPALNDDSAVSFSYTITDSTDTVAGSATLDITPVNDAPTTSAVILTAIAEDSGARLITQAQLLANASDVEGDSLTATGLAISAGSGTLVDNFDGTWNYTPALNDDSAVSFSYTITDSTDTVAGSATLDITPVNDAPTTSPVTLTAIAEDSSARTITQGELLANAADTEGDSLTATGLSINSGSGTLVDNLDGTWSYTPALNDDTTVSFSYSITDDTDTVAGSATLDITPVNDAPTTSPVTLTAVAEDSGVRLITQAELLVNASDIEGDSLTATGLAISAGSGTLVDNLDGTWNHSPALNDDTAVSFSYSTTDGSDTVTGSATLDITPVNDAPTTTPVTLAPIAEDSGGRLITQAQLLANASDIEGDSLTATGLAISAGSGTLVDNFDGTWNYTPALNDDTTVSFSYSITDGTDTVAGSANLNITSVNDPPTTSPVALTAVAEDSGVRLITQAELLANASDVEGDSLAATGLSVSGGAGTLVDNFDGTWNYTLALNDDSAVSFSYTITDSTDTVAGSATLDITPVNDAPTTSPVTLTAIAEDSSARTITQGELLANAADTEGDSLTATGLSINSGSGTLVDNLDGTWSYTPALNDDTTVGFSYSITDDTDTVAGSATLDITPVNDAPTTSPVTLTAVAEDSGVRLITQAELLANASDVEGDSLAATGLSVSGGAGTLVDNFDGTWNYTPALNDDSAVSFSYTITDSTDTVAGSATLDITPVNDAPTTSPVTLTAIAEDSSARTITQGELLANAADTEGNSLTATGLSINSGSGTLVDNLDGTWSYTPAASDDTAVNFSYSITDGTDTLAGSATLDITPASDPPTTTPVTLVPIAEDNGARLITQAQLLANAADTEGDSLTATGLTINSGSGTLVDNLDGTWNYFPALNDDTTVSFSYSISDGTNAVAGSATLAIIPVNDAPTTSPVTLTAIAEDSGTRVITQAELLANASDTEGDSLTATSLTISAGSGTLVDNLDGTWSYTPALNDDTAVSFSYTITDSVDTVAGSATLDITPVNDVPVAANDGYGTAEDMALTAVVGVDDLLQNDSDVDGDALSVNTTPVSDVSNGTLVLNANGTFTYTPNTNFTGSDSFTYALSDGNGGTAQATVTITVTAVNDTPTTTGLSAAAVDEDAANSVADLFAAFADTENGDANLTYTITANTNSALFSATPIDAVAGALTLDYAPDAHGTADITVRATDTGGLWVESTFTVTINPVNDAPTASPATLAAIAEDSGIRLITQAQLLANAGDVDGDRLTATNLALSAGNGTLLDNGDSTWNYTPAADDDTSVSFSYTITDGSDTVAASAALNITPVNDVPVANDDNTSTAGDTAVTIANVLTNDDPGDETTSITAYDARSANGGTVVSNGDGTFTYTPPVDFIGSDSFGYTITDIDGETSTATVTISVVPVSESDNGAPTTGTRSQNVEPPREYIAAPNFGSGDTISDDSDDKAYKLLLPYSDSSSTWKGGASSLATNQEKAIAEINEADETGIPIDAVAAADQAGTPQSSEEVLSGADLVEALVAERPDSLEAQPAEPNRLIPDYEAPLMANPTFLNALDKARADLSQAGTLDEHRLKLLVGGTVATGISLTAGFVTWAIRGGSLLTALVAGVPVWKGFDPLPVVLMSRQSRKERDRKKELEVDREAVARDANEERLFDAESTSESSEKHGTRHS